MLRVLKGVLAAVVLAGALVVGLFVFTSYGDHSKPAQPTRVVIERGSTLSDVARQLAQSDVIESALAFRVLARARHDDADVHAGAYLFPPHQTSDEILRALLTGGAQIATWVAIPEGFTAAQIAQRLQQAGVGQAGTFERSFAESSLALDGQRTKGLEGFLFPSTYLVPLDASARQIQNQMTGEFLKQLPSDAAVRARALHVSVLETVTVASLVEREAKIDADRPMIAGVIYNRLRLRMPLQVDATIEYALPSHKAELSYADLKIDSPYNTYVHEGLPPTPIANPGHPSLEAAFNPSKTDMLYYVYCGNGHHVFAKTLAEHQANVARCLH